MVAGCSSGAADSSGANATTTRASAAADVPAAVESAPGSSGLAAASSSAAVVTGPVVVFAAASLKDTFTTLAAAFEAAHPGARIVASFGGSDTLAAQIVSGAPVDVFASADTSTMAAVTKAGDTQGEPQVFARNALEIAVPAANPKRVAGLSDVAKPGVKLALCASTVPCGSAAAKAFAAAHVTPHPVTLEQDVTSVLTKVELGEVDAGVVYQTDVKSAGSKVLGVNFAQAAAAVNSYPIAVVTTRRSRAAAAAFVAYVLSPAGRAVLRAAGFLQP